MQVINKDNQFITPLFNIEIPKDKQPLDRKTERGELLRFFVDNIKNKQDKSYGFPFISMKLAHLKINDLYYLVSSCKDRLNRDGQVTMQKYFWWSIKYDKSQG